MGDLERRMSAQTSINRVLGVTVAENFRTLDKHTVVVYGRMLDEYWQAARTTHDALITSRDCDDDLRQAHEDSLARIERMYLQARAAIYRRLENIAEEVQRAQQAAEAAVPPPPPPAVHAAPNERNDARMVELLEGMRLDATRLPKFDGDRSKWLKFHDEFTANVHNKNYPNTVKLSRLRECLAGAALRVIDAAQPADGDTYAGAWTALKDRYDNKRFLVNSHLNAIFNFRLNGKHDIMRMVDTFEATIRALDALNIATAGWDAILSYILLRKLDDSTRTAWEMDQREANIPPFTELLAFLKRRANSFDFAQMGHSEARSGSNQRTGALVHSVTMDGHAEQVCAFCNRKEHKSAACSKLLQLPMNKRFGLVRKVRDLCYNCLQVGHFTPNCSSGNCRICNGRHHTVLCRSDAADQTQQIGARPPAVHVATMAPTASMPSWSAQLNA